MARDVIPLGPGPAAESSARIGDSGYAEIAFLQGRRYIALLRLAIGLEPDGARLRVRRSDIEFEPYIDVVVEYDDQNAAAAAYALRCERDAPARWREPSVRPTFPAHPGSDGRPASAEDDPAAMRVALIGELDTPPIGRATSAREQAGRGAPAVG